MTRKLTRRAFIASSLASLAAGSSHIRAQQRGRPGGIPTRPLGRTGERVSIVGLGGWTIGQRKIADADALRIIETALDHGMTFLDNCWEYNQGRSEELFGRVLERGTRRDQAFLMTKCCGRVEQDAMSQLEDSLRRTRTDRIDLWMFHGIRRWADREWIFGPGGAMEAALKAKEQGKVRYIGFSGHESPKFHLNMMQEAIDWDAIMMPTNAFDYHYDSFQKDVLPVCSQREIGVVGMKALAAGRIPQTTPLDVRLCRRYALSLPIATLACGIESMEELEQDLSLARDFSPLDGDEVAQMHAQALELLGQDVHVERYKDGNTGCEWHMRNRLKQPKDSIA